MAGDWLKVECNTPDKPEVIGIADMLGIPPTQAFGGLFMVWRWFDQHTTGGNASFVTKVTVDRLSGVTGFADAMARVGWLLISDDDSITLPHFGRHNGETAKQRGLTAKRVAKSKAIGNATSNATGNDKVTDDSLPREREEEEKSKPLKSKSRAGDASATRLPADWTPSDVDQDFCRSQRPDLNPEAVAAGFRDYWASVPGVKGRKLDWSATWRNWVRNEKTVKENPRSINSAGRRTPAREDFSKIDYGTGGLL